MTSSIALPAGRSARHLQFHRKAHNRPDEIHSGSHGIRNSISRSPAIISRNRASRPATRFYPGYYYRSRSLVFPKFPQPRKIKRARPLVHCSPARYIAPAMVYCTIRRTFGIQVSRAFELGSSSLRLPTALWHVRRYIRDQPHYVPNKHTHTHAHRLNGGNRTYTYTYTAGRCRAAVGRNKL